MDGWMDGWMSGWMDGWMDEWKLSEPGAVSHQRVGFMELLSVHDRTGFA